MPTTLINVRIKQTSWRNRICYSGTTFLLIVYLRVGSYEQNTLIIGINKDESAGVRGIKKQTRSGIHTRPETRCTNKQIYQKIEWTHDIQISSFTSRGANVFSSLAAGLSPAAEGGRDLRRGQRQGHVHLALVAGLGWV